MSHGAKSWVSDFNHPHYQAARNAVLRGSLNGYIDLKALNISKFYCYSF